MDTPTLVSVLKRLAEARLGPQRLELPPDLRPDAAVEAVRAAIGMLEPVATPTPPASVARSARIHIDGASRGNPGPAGIGVAIYDADGGILERIHQGIGEATNNVAEYRALLTALDRAAALGISELEIRSDSELLVRQLLGRYQVRHPGLKPLYAAARERIGDFRRVQFRHVPRELNAEADALANQGIDEAARSGMGRVGQART